jgi:uncharacterized membrane protein YeiH
MIELADIALTLRLLDYAATVVFALTGALVASRSQLDIVGFIFIACLTAVGGGSLRDVLLDRPVFWMADPLVLALASGAAVVVFFMAHLLESRYAAMRWLDAFALAIAVPAGVAAALSVGVGWPVVIVMGVMVCNEVPLVLRQGELYVTAAFCGVGAALMAGLLGQTVLVPLVVCAAVTLVLRAGSMAFGWRLPVYRSAPPRPDSPKRDG